MIRSILAGAAALGLVLAAAAGAATAQSPVNPSNQPIMIGADRAERTPTGFSLSGRAEVLQGDNRLRADGIQGVGGDSGGISQVTASGNVYYVTPTETIRGDRAVYTVATANIVITGEVILTQGRNVLTGRRLTYNIDTGTARMEGSSDGGAGQRIQGVFYPQKSGG
ncbi:LptA/OstA family protein [uncultured Brevundimonas sp.]|uniref:LptA/OstA family protein n=1 Tax=uncultured Brevundimonas sp. TaxID=213418 RepID=UPI0030EEB58C|tara:strand:+ start:28946 stop:29446 length:501 start_codon:yes stop_codon:yes gene_type:complete